MPPEPTPCTVAAGVVIHADGRDIEATVSGGQFLAWWPGGTEADWSALTRLPDV